MSREPATVVSSDVAIHEVDHPDSSSESSGADANDAMAAAGLQMAAYNAQQDHFFTALHNMVCPLKLHAPAAAGWLWNIDERVSVAWRCISYCGASSPPSSLAPCAGEPAGCAARAADRAAGGPQLPGPAAGPQPGMHCLACTAPGARNSVCWACLCSLRMSSCLQAVRSVMQCVMCWRTGGQRRCAAARSGQGRPSGSRHHRGVCMQHALH